MNTIGADYAVASPHVQRLADFVVGTPELPPDVVEQSTRFLIDGVGVGLLGSRGESARGLLQSVPRTPVPTGATIWGHPGIVHPYTAAMLNGAFIHQTEYGEGASRAVVHASSIVIPAALAVAEEIHASGAQLLRAIGLATETIYRFGYALASDPRRPPSKRLVGDSAVAMKHGWWTPAMLAPIGASTAAALLKGCSDTAELLNVWGIAVNLCPTATTSVLKDGSTAKGAFLGVGTGSGLLAAELGRHGLTGTQDIEVTWMKPLVPVFDADRLDDRLGSNYELLYTMFKQFATIGPIFAPLEAIFEILRLYPDLDNAHIEHIEFEAYGRTLTVPSYEPPHSAEGAKSALPYCVAEALVRRDRSVFVTEAFTEKEYANPLTLELASKVTAVFNAEYDRLYPHLGAKSRVKIMLKSGDLLTAEVDRDQIPRYHYPTFDECGEKFHAAVNGVLAQDRAGRLFEQLLQIGREPDAAVALRDLLAAT